ncbi:hypothetical protein [Acinetobacter vivianii]|uniref:hypothetical protein n=1 Tax=Acinetobacter vivianii TaxID=1776742 RepID=UPI001905C82B|nr:hypothetical protein [Acinetobacter vivianii]MBJ8482947.1 hypothetical protein [Acinetobacter vivianii]
MNQKQKELLKTACLIRTQSFIEQEFDYFSLLKSQPELLNSLKELNEYVLNLFLQKSWATIEENRHPSMGKVEQILNLNSQDYFNCEVIACFWGNAQYGQDFKNPIHNWFNLNSTREFHSAYFEVFSLIRKNADFNAIYLEVQQLASCYDLAALSYRTQLDLDKYIIPMYLEFFMALQTLSYREENFEGYYVLVNFLTPIDTLKRGASSVLLQPLNHLSWSNLVGRDSENKIVEMQEGILHFQIPIGEDSSFHEIFFSNYYALYLLLNKNLTSKIWKNIEELEEILEFLSKKLTSKKNAHLKEKSTLVAYETLILEYFCTFKKDEYCKNGLSEPNGFNKFLYTALTTELNKIADSGYKFEHPSYKEGLEGVEIKLTNSEIRLSLKHESIRKNLERRKKLHQSPQILKQENSAQNKSHLVDFSKISEELGDYHFCERK